MNLTAIFTPELIQLRAEYVARGHDLRLVGGAVRDLLREVTPKDLDFATDATPDEQIEIYKALGLRYIETGLQHGTVTVVVGGEPYEITSLRTETDHDGRHAVVSYTRDWMSDLARRDLTFNAMALTFDGVLIDPFNGADDMANKVVRFVGDADARMREDYLRILRWLRFHARIANNGNLVEEMISAAKRQGHGLQGISRERVWMEMSKIVVGNVAAEMVMAIYEMGLHEVMDLPVGDPYAIENAVVLGQSKNPVTAMVALLGSDVEAVTKLAADWKWSAEERDFGIWLAKARTANTGDYRRMVSFDEAPVAWAAEVARMGGGNRFAEQLMTEVFPVFPVKGQDLLDAGMKPGREVGQVLKLLREAWAVNDYNMTKEELVAVAPI